MQIHGNSRCLDAKKPSCSGPWAHQGLLTQVVRLPIPDDATLDKSRFHAQQYEGNKARKPFKALWCPVAGEGDVPGARVTAADPAVHASHGSDQ